MTSTINASTTAGLVQTADTSGVLALQTAGTTAISIDASQAVTMAGRTSNPTTISVGAATPSTSGAGITFPATQSASTDANTLDDYEEGTYTPTAANFSTTGASTLSGTYTKIGRVVYFNATFTNTGTIAFSTSCLISLPFSGIFQSGMVAMALESNAESQTSGKSGVQISLDAVNSRFFVGNFTTTSAGQTLQFGGFYRVS